MAFYEEVSRLELEGIVAKRADVPYRAGRSDAWLKIRVDRTGDFVVVGFTRPDGSRLGFGALHLGQYLDGRLLYSGRAGTGFSDDQLRSIRAGLEGDRRSEPAFEGPAPRGAEHVWVEPRLVAEVRYKEWTQEHLLRQPVFLRFRDDKPLPECVRVDGGGAARPPLPDLGLLGNDASLEHKVSFSSLGKTFGPEEGYTKGDLALFYRKVSPWLLPYLRDRPLVLTRYPGGVAGKSSFRKDAPGLVPGPVRVERMWSEDAQQEIDCFFADDADTLLSIVDLGTIPLDIWASRTRDIAHPDWCVLGLDANEAPLLHVVRVARALQQLAEEMEVEAYVKTSGSSGLHVLIPLGGQCTFEQCKGLGELVARVVAERLPDIATTAPLPASRVGRVHVDFLQNGHGKLLAAPWSARPASEALVSTPLDWDDVNDDLSPARFTIRTVPERLAKTGRDPLGPVLSGRPDLGRAIARLAERLPAEIRPLPTGPAAVSRSGP
jgi:bifunctional non-homologous end joining protein LigD